MIYPKASNVYPLILLAVLVVWHLLKRKTFDESQLGRRPILFDVTLFILTAGMATYGWLLRMTEILNRKAQRPISVKFQTATLLYAFGMIFWNLILNRYFKHFMQSSDGQNFTLLFTVAGSFLSIVWSFEIRRLVMERTSRQYSAILTFLFSVLYCAYFIRKTFKVQVPRRPWSRLTRTVFAYSGSLLGLALLFFPITIGLRQYAFHSIHANRELMKKQAGYWRRVTTGSLSYELIYELHEDGVMTMSVAYFSNSKNPAALLDVKCHSKINAESSYELSWTSKISVDTVIEMTENSRVVMENEVNQDVLRDVRITKEEFDRIHSEFEDYRNLSPSIVAISKMIEGPGIYRTQLKAERSQESDLRRGRL